MSLAPLIAIPATAALSAALIVILRPLLIRYALARPNARSSHAVPTPQGGGVAIVVATLVAAGTASAMQGGASIEAVVLALAAVALALLGAIDDIRPLPAILRLAIQALVVTALVMAVDGRLFPHLPAFVERVLSVLAGLWFVNLVNFMDGLDWMTVAEVVPVAGALLLLGFFGVLTPFPTLVVACLLGGMLGFAPFNRPVAGLFLGDVGSLPIGLITAWALYHLALEGGLAAACLLPLYYLADATLTLLRRAARGERVWEAHRGHYYQRATANGLTVMGVVTRVFLLNLWLAALAGATLLWPSWPVTVAALVAGAGAVALILWEFARPRRVALGRQEGMRL